MVERDRLDADLHLAGAGRRRVGQFGQFELAVGDKVVARAWDGFGAARRSGRLAPHHQRDVLPAEAERIRNGVRHLGVARRIRHDVERDRRVRHRRN